MAKKVRAFLAIETPPEIRQALSRLVKKLDKSGSVVNWVEGENLHLTLKFLGDIDITDVAEIYLRLKRDLAKVEPFEVNVQGLGAFPDISRPRTVWAGVSDGAEEMTAMFEVVEDSLMDLRFRKEARRFSPHLTIGRVKEATPELSELLKEHAGFATGVLDVEEIVLFSSELERTGPVYEPLARIPLGAE
jgi:2'-5' RNA ligase